MGVGADRDRVCRMYPVGPGETSCHRPPGRFPERVRQDAAWERKGRRRTGRPMVPVKVANFPLDSVAVKVANFPLDSVAEIPFGFSSEFPFGFKRSEGRRFAAFTPLHSVPGRRQGIWAAGILPPAHGFSSAAVPELRGRTSAVRAAGPPRRCSTRGGAVRHAGPRRAAAQQIAPHGTPHRSTSKRRAQPVTPPSPALIHTFLSARPAPCARKGPSPRESPARDRSGAAVRLGASAPGHVTPRPRPDALAALHRTRPPRRRRRRRRRRSRCTALAEGASPAER